DVVGPGEGGALVQAPVDGGAAGDEGVGRGRAAVEGQGRVQHRGDVDGAGAVVADEVAVDAVGQAAVRGGVPDEVVAAPVIDRFTPQVIGGAGPRPQRVARHDRVVQMGWGTRLGDLVVNPSPSADHVAVRVCPVEGNGAVRYGHQTLGVVYSSSV